jgi:Spy/CpxP family protein refolding chaperone
MTFSQSKYKTLVAIIALLLITNIAVLAYFIFSHKKKMNDRDRSRFGFEALLKREVGFSDEQTAQFKELREAYWATAQQKMNELKQVKQNLLNLTKEENVPDSVMNTLADSIALLQKQIELNSFQHFKSVRKICTPEQQPAYDSFMKKIILRMDRGTGKPSARQKK